MVLYYGLNDRLLKLPYPMIEIYETEHKGIGTKSQQALQLQRDEMKAERRQISREQKDAELQRRFEMKQRKKKEKRRGH